MAGPRRQLAPRHRALNLSAPAHGGGFLCPCAMFDGAGATLARGPGPARRFAPSLLSQAQGQRQVKGMGSPSSTSVELSPIVTVTV